MLRKYGGKDCDRKQRRDPVETVINIGGSMTRGKSIEQISDYRILTRNLQSGFINL